MTTFPRRHGLISNIAYALRTITQCDRRYPLYVIALIGFTLIQPLLSSLLPALAVSLISRDAAYSVYALAIFIAVVVYALCAVGLHCTSFHLNIDLMEIIFEYTLLSKWVTMDYCSIEQHATQALKTSADRSLNNNRSGPRGLLSQVTVWLYSLLGLLLYGSVAAMLDGRILLLLAAMVVSSMAFSALHRRYDRTHDHAWRGWWNKFEYLCDAAGHRTAGKDARLYRMEAWFQESMLHMIKQIFSKECRSQALRFFGNASNDIFLFLRDLLSYAILIHACYTGDIDPAGFTLMLGMIVSFSGWLTDFVEADSILKDASQQTEYYREMLEYPSVMRHGEGTDTAELSRPLSVELKDVSFTHPDSDTPALSHVNLTVHPGEHIALVGVNGAGKTTLVKLLCGLYPVTEGEILISGVPLKNFSFEDWRRIAAPLFQDVNAFAFTLAENIACSDTYDEARVMDCLRRAGLDDFVKTLPRGIHTPLTRYFEEEGIELSGGQMQRLLFARMLYHGGDLLLLDEPTAALDPLAEASLYQQYADATRGKTCFFISHRLASTRFCDRILFIEHGQIIEEGSHEELMAKGGRYAEMFAVQSQYYLKEGKLHEKPV